MRRIAGLALVGLGAFLLVAALLTRTYVAGQLVKFPLNTYVKTTLIGKDVSYFSPKLVRPVTGATMEVTDTVKGDGAAGNSSTAVWDEFTYLYDRTNHAEFSYTTRRAAFDRRTAVLVDCCGANIGGNSSIRQTGLSGYVWPIGTQKQTYDVFDTTLLRPMPFRYAGTGTIHGISVYRFVEKVAPTQSGTQQVPGSLVGSSQNLVTLPEYYAATSTFWVDPRTGGVLDSTAYSKQYLRQYRHRPGPAAVQRHPGHDAGQREHRGGAGRHRPHRTGLVRGDRPADRRRGGPRGAGRRDRAGPAARRPAGGGARRGARARAGPGGLVSRAERPGGVWLAAFRSAAAQAAGSR